MKRITVIFLMIFFVVNVSSCSNNTAEQTNNNVETKNIQNSLPYPLVKWNNHVYKITNENVDEVDKEIGVIEHHSLNEVENTPDNFSNFYSTGTKLYSIKGIDTNKSIAVQTKEGNYVKVDSSSTSN